MNVYFLFELWFQREKVYDKPTYRSLCLNSMCVCVLRILNCKMQIFLRNKESSKCFKNYATLFISCTIIDPLGRPTVTAVVIIVFAHVVGPHFSKSLSKQNKRKQCSLLARLWVWPSGSLMTPVLFILPLACQKCLLATSSMLVPILTSRYWLMACCNCLMTLDNDIN